MSIRCWRCWSPAGGNLSLSVWGRRPWAHRSLARTPGSWPHSGVQHLPPPQGSPEVKKKHMLFSPSPAKKESMGLADITGSCVVYFSTSQQTSLGESSCGRHGNALPEPNIVTVRDPASVWSGQPAKAQQALSLVIRRSSRMLMVEVFPPHPSRIPSLLCVWTQNEELNLHSADVFYISTIPMKKAAKTRHC